MATQRTGELLFRNVLEHEDSGVQFLVGFRRDMLRWYKLRKQEGEDVVELREGVKALSVSVRVRMVRGICCICVNIFFS